MVGIGGDASLDVRSLRVRQHLPLRLQMTIRLPFRFDGRVSRIFVIIFTFGAPFRVSTFDLSLPLCWR
jgi:hypothetical protein